MNLTLDKVIARLKLMRGEKFWGMSIFGISIFLIAKRDPYHSNVFILFLPLLRIEKSSTRFGINFLPLVWVCKMFKIMLTKWSFHKTEYQVSICFLGKTVFSRVTAAPYKFPTALYRG